MIRRLLLIVPLLAVSALARAGLVHQGPRKVYVGGAAKDYVPTQATVFFVGGGSANNIMMAVYTSAGSQICASASTAIGTGLPKLLTVTLVGCSALTPGNLYVVSLTADGYPYLRIKTSGTYQDRLNTRGTYPSIPATVDPVNDTILNQAEYYVAVKNASGVELFGDTDYTIYTSTSPGFSSSSSNGYYRYGFTCVTQ